MDTQNQEKYTHRNVGRSKLAKQHKGLQILSVTVRHRSDEHVWLCIGIIAEAEVWNPQTLVVQRIRSGGLWGIESDSGKRYIADVEKEELYQLRNELQAFGIKSGEIDRAFANVKYTRAAVED